MPDGVRRAADAAASPVQHVGVDHRCFHIAVARQFLDCTNIVAIGQQVHRKGMPERVARESPAPVGDVPPEVEPLAGALS